MKDLKRKVKRWMISYRNQAVQGYLVLNIIVAIFNMILMYHNNKELIIMNIILMAAICIYSIFLLIATMVYIKSKINIKTNLRYTVLYGAVTIIFILAIIMKTIQL